MKSDGNLEHIAFIMDGNLRYSNMQGIEKRDGYTAGIDVANELMTYCAEKGIRHITFFAFSTENWFRNSQDVNMLISVFEEYLEIQKEQIKNGKNSRFRILFRGDRSAFSAKAQLLMSEIEECNSSGYDTTCTIAVNYGGRQEILDCVFNSTLKAVNDCGDIKINADNKINADKINIDDYSGSTHVAKMAQENFLNEMDSYKQIDMLVRTGGYRRISNFALWNLLYTELFFTETLWPEFTTIELGAMIDDFYRSKRKFGR